MRIYVCTNAAITVRAVPEIAKICVYTDEVSKFWRVRWVVVKIFIIADRRLR